MRPVGTGKRQIGIDKEIGMGLADGATMPYYQKKGTHMKEFGTRSDFDFKVDQQNLYREEAITDMKVASIRRLVPIKADGSDDTSRSPVFIGSTQLMTPEGPLPLQTRLPANTLAEAFEEFPDAMQKALGEMVQRLEQLQQQHQQQQQSQKREGSRIIVPGR